MNLTKKWALVVGVACLLGCEEPSDDERECGFGELDLDGSCVCDEGYTHSLGGSCTECAEGYERVDGSDRCEVTEKCLTTFSYYHPDTTDIPVYLVGSFNSWNPEDKAYEMVSDGKGTHTLSVEWPYGARYEYKFYVGTWGNAGWITDESNAAIVGDGNALAEVWQCGQRYGNGSGEPTLPGGIIGAWPEGQLTTKIFLKEQPVTAGNTVSFSILADTTEGITVSGGSGQAVLSGTHVTDTVPTTGKYVYTVRLGDEELYVPVWVESEPFDWHDAVLYFAFTDRFANGDLSNDAPRSDATAKAEWFGGDFRGLQQKVEAGYFEALGVNTLWLSSVSMNTQGTSGGTGDTYRYSAYHSYWPVTTFMTAENESMFSGETSAGVPLTAIEPHFGTMEDLKSLVDACHSRGIRVLVDFAANHVHVDSPIYKQHPEWFNGDASNAKICDGDNGANWDKYPETCWFSSDLPDIDYNQEEVRRLMVEHAIWLIKTTNIDGFRVDAVKHMAIEFIRDLRMAVNSLFDKTGTTFYMVGETFSGDVGLINKYIGQTLLHAQFDFNLYFSLTGNLFGGDVNFENVRGTLAQQKNYYSDLMGTFMGNHDVARAISVAAGHSQEKWGDNPEVNDGAAYLKLKTAWTILLTNPGIPLIYYGDEYGLEGANDPDNRRMMEFGDALNDWQKDTLSYVQKLGQLRREHRAMRRGVREDLDVQQKAWCYKVSDGSETILVGVAYDGGNSCQLGGSYQLENLLDPSEATVSASSLDLSSKKLQVYKVK